MKKIMFANLFLSLAINAMDHETEIKDLIDNSKDKLWSHIIPDKISAEKFELFDNNILGTLNEDIFNNKIILSFIDLNNNQEYMPAIQLDGVRQRYFKYSKTTGDKWLLFYTSKIFIIDISNKKLETIDTGSVEGKYLNVEIKGNRCYAFSKDTILTIDLGSLEPVIQTVRGQEVKEALVNSSNNIIAMSENTITIRNSYGEILSRREFKGYTLKNIVELNDAIYVLCTNYFNNAFTVLKLDSNNLNAECEKLLTDENDPTYYYHNDAQLKKYGAIIAFTRTYDDRHNVFAQIFAIDSKNYVSYNIIKISPHQYNKAQSQIIYFYNGAHYVITNDNKVNVFSLDGNLIDDTEDSYYICKDSDEVYAIKLELTGSKDDLNYMPHYNIFTLGGDKIATIKSPAFSFKFIKFSEDKKIALIRTDFTGLHIYNSHLSLKEKSIDQLEQLIESAPGELSEQEKQMAIWQMDYVNKASQEYFQQWKRCYFNS